MMHPPKLGNASAGLEIVDDGLRLDIPLLGVGAVSILVYKLSCIILVLRLDLILPILNVWAVDTEVLNKGWGFPSKYKMNH